MARRTRHPRSSSSRHETAAQQQPSAKLHGILAGALLVVVTARTLLPGGTTTQQGDGLPLVMMTLLLATLWMLAAVLRRSLVLRFTAIDACVVLLFACEILAAAIGARDGVPRASINMLWELVALACVYLLARQLLDARGALAAVMVLVALAVAQAGFGLHQYFISMPADRAAYADDPERALREAGLDAPPGSTIRQLWEQRLASTEPMARFALPNSLAGFLTLGIVALAASVLAARPATWQGWALAAAIAIPLIACLVLTKARSAYLATILGVAITWPLLRGLSRRTLLSIAGVTGVAFALLFGAWLAGSIDREVLSEAPKSFTYRVEYWQATLAMIADRPWLGCGLGNFQDIYTAYKLPASSEEVADPHNFILEVWATGGTLSMLALVGTLAALVMRLARHRSSTVASDPRTPPSNSPRSAPRLLALVSLVCGFHAAFACGQVTDIPLSQSELVGGLAVGVVALVALWGIPLSQVTAWCPALAALALALHLLAAGGIHFPALAGWWWLLVACVATFTDRPSAERDVGNSAAIAGLIASALLLVICYRTAYGPVFASRLLVEGAASPRISLDEQLALLEDAAARDPLSPEPWAGRAALRFYAAKESTATANELRLLQAEIDGLLRRRPHSSAAHEQAADWYFDWYRRFQNHDALELSLATYSRAAELYPTRAVLHAKWALALAAAGRRDEFEKHRDRALELDELTPHSDKKLPEALREELRAASATRN